MRFLYTLILSGILSLFSSPIYAQADILPASGYFLAPDDADILQVWRLSMDGNSEIQTHAQSNIQGYAVSPDEQQIAYFSGGQLWLQKSDSAAEVIVPQIAEEFFLTPSFSPDGMHIAYTDGGIRVLDLADRTSDLILPDVPLNDQFGSIHRYYPVQYLDANTLYIQHFDYGPYDSVAFPALLNLNTRDLNVDNEAQPYAGLSMTPLSDGRLLFTAYSRIGMGMPGLVLVNGDLTPSQILLADEPRLKEDPASDIMMPIPHAVEAQPGKLRFIGERLVPEFGYELFDYDLASGALVVDTNILKPISGWSFNQLSPDGKLIAGLANYDWQTGQGGDLAMIDLTTGKTLDLHFPDHVYSFQWHMIPA